MSAFFFSNGGVEEDWGFPFPSPVTAPVTAPALAHAGEGDNNDHHLPLGYLISHDDSDDHACPAEPGSARPSFLHNILNPVDYTFTNHDMSPARPSNGYVDLTHESPDVSAHKKRRESPTPGPSTKKLRRNDGTAAPANPDDAIVEAVDLSVDKPKDLDVPQKQKEQQPQPNDEEKPTTFNTFNCVICMDTPTDLTATACGW